MSLKGKVCPNGDCSGSLEAKKGILVCNKCDQIVHSENHWLTLCRLSTLDQTKLQSSLEAAGY
ncbi:MAG: hypothetical protein AAB575_05100 [Patescibacteria group bacterium]